MSIKLDEDERVRAADGTYAIGDKVYGTDDAALGVGYIQAIEVLPGMLSFRAKITSTIADEPEWFDARCLSKDAPDWVDDRFKEPQE
jgi:hypothetical protein